MSYSFNNKGLIRSGVNYSIASTISALCTMAVGFLNMRWLGPELLGIWQSVVIINSYLPIVQLGIQSGLNLELPIILGENNIEKAKQFVATALFYAIFLAILLTVISILVVPYIAAKVNDEKVTLGLCVVCAMAVFSCFRLHYIATYRSANAFNKLAVIYWFDSFVTLAMIVLIYKYQYYGLLIFHAAKEFFFAFLMFWFAPYRSVRPCFYREHFLVLLKRGVFMTVFNEIKGIVESLPSVLLLKFGGTTMVGIFNPALVVGTFVNLIPNQLAQFLHPQFGMKYGRTKNAKDMWPYFLKLTYLVPICLIPIAVVGWFALPYVITYLFPKYLPSLWPVRIMLIGFLFSTTYFSRGFLITIKAYKIVILLQFVDLMIFGGLSILFMLYDEHNILVLLAVALSISYFLTYFINIIIVYFTIRKPCYNNE